MAIPKLVGFIDGATLRTLPAYLELMSGQWSDAEFADLVAFVRDALLDPRARPGYLRRLVPKQLPSGRSPLVFEFGP